MNADALLLEDIAAIRASLATQKFLCFQGPDPFWEDILAVIAATNPLPPDTVICWTILEDGDPVPDNRGGSHPQGVSPAPVLPQKAIAIAFPPMSASSEQRTHDPFPEPDPRVLERVVRMAKRRQLRIHHTGVEWCSLIASDGSVPFEGTVAEVYAALKADTVKQLPTDPAAELRRRLDFADSGWTLTTELDGRFTLCKGNPAQRIYTDSLEGCTAYAVSRIFNVVNWNSYA